MGRVAPTGTTSRSWSARRERRLRRLGQIGDLVEKERAPLRGANEAQLVPHGSGERPSHVPEELALYEPFGERAAVDRHELTAPPRRLVDGARQHPPCRLPTLLG